MGVILLTTQLGFWTGVFSDTRFNPSELDARFTSGVTVLNWFGYGPIFAAGLMASLLRTGWKDMSIVLQITTRLLVVITWLAIMPVVTFLVSFPTALLEDLLPFAPEPGRGYTEYNSWSKTFDIYGRTLFALIPYALLSALIACLITSRVAAVVIVGVLAIFETIILDLTIGWFDSLNWIFGLSLKDMYYFWIQQEDAIWSMKHILGLSEDVQGVTVISLHIAWMSVAICYFAKKPRLETTTSLPQCGGP